jgi:hypothetical protein
MHPLLAVVVAYCVASYAVAVGYSAYHWFWKGAPSDPGAATVIVVWMVLAPVTFPLVLVGFISHLAQGHAGSDSAPLACILAHNAIFVVTLWLLVRRRKPADGKMAT